MKWVPAMKRDKWIPSKYSYICSEHFNIANYIVPPGQAYTKLRKSAVPSKFNFRNKVNTIYANSSSESINKTCCGERCNRMNKTTRAHNINKQKKSTKHKSLTSERSNK